ncbi:MAG: peptidylprolyl isomerase [Candidatus Aenigmarchaeota archaeon]|nr:peptidylprolyl isomerase [Candidatus Aenigmarchaeota archaeon]
MKEKEFVEIDYIGSVRETSEPFDFTTGEAAKKYGVEKPVVIIIGAGHVMRGLDEEIKKHKVGDEFEVEIPPDKAFGPRSSKLVKLIPFREFKKHDLSPYPGMRVDFDGLPGRVRSVSGGRVIVDFNHPLAGKTLHYWVRINRKVTKRKEKVESILEFYDLKEFKTRFSKEKLVVTAEKPVPEHVQGALKAAIEEHIGLKMVNFQQKVNQQKSK